MRHADAAALAWRNGRQPAQPTQPTPKSLLPGAQHERAGRGRHQYQWTYKRKAESRIPRSLFQDHEMQLTNCSPSCVWSRIDTGKDDTCTIRDMIHVHEVAAWAGGKEEHLGPETMHVMGELYCAWLANSKVGKSSPEKLQEYRRGIATDLEKPGGAIELLKYMKLSHCWPSV